MKILDKAIVHRGVKFDFAIHRLQTRSGGEIRREFIDHPGSVVLVPIAPDGRIVMVRNYRHAVDQTLLELPAGTCSRGEAPEAAAVRELAEETGYRAGRWERIFDMLPLPGATNEHMVYFRATDLKEGPLALEVDEEIQVELIALTEALARIDRGEIRDAKSIIGLWLEARCRS